MTSKGIDLLRHSIREHRRGKYAQLLGDDYARALRMRTVNDLIIGTLQDSQRKAILETAFDEFAPLPDELILGIYGHDLLTDRRFFAGTENGPLFCPPISLADIESYQAPSLLEEQQVIKLKSGETIEREVSRYPANWIFEKVIQMASDPEYRDELHGPSIYPTDHVEQAGESAQAPSAQEETAIERLEVHATRLAAGSELHSWALCVWDTTKLKVSNAFQLWAGRALLGVAGDILHANERALGLAVATKDGQLLVAGLGKTLAGFPIEPEKISWRKSTCELILTVPSSTLDPDPILNTMTVNGVDLEFPDCFVFGNKNFPKKAMEARFGLESDTDDDAFIAGPLPLRASEVISNVIFFAVFVAVVLTVWGLFFW